jgi:hypothetical protein
MARTKNPVPHAARSAADSATEPVPAPVAPAAGGSPAAAVLAALSAEPGGAAVAVIAGHAGISVVAARQALIAHEKNGTAPRIKGGKPGVPDAWKPAAGPDSPAPPAEAPARDTPAVGGQPASVAGTAEGGEPEAVAAPDPDPAVTAEASGNVLAVVQAADEAGKALAAGNLPAALAALDAVREQAAQGRRALKAAASGRHAPATRPGALRDLVEQHLRTFPDAAFTPHQIGKVLTHSVGRRGRQRPGQAHRPRHRRAGLRQAPQLPPRPRARPGRRRRSRHQCGGRAQRRVTRGTRRHAGRDGRTPPRPACRWVSPAIGRKLKGGSQSPAMGSSSHRCRGCRPGCQPRNTGSRGTCSCWYSPYRRPAIR